MSIRLGNSSSSRTQQSNHTPRQSFSKHDGHQSSSKSSILSVGRPRSHEPKPRPHMSTESPTPTPRKSRRHNKGSRRPEQRDPVSILQFDDEDHQGVSMGDDLSGLLGVEPALTIAASSAPSSPAAPVTPRRGGVLAISRADITESKKGRRGGKKQENVVEMERKSSQTERKTPGKKGGRKAHVVEKGFEVVESATPSKAGTHVERLPKSTTKVASGRSGLAATRTGKQSVKSLYHVDDTDFTHAKPNADPLDISALSRSLPGLHGDILAGIPKQRDGQRTKSGEDLWDTPTKVGNEAPTWQQTLQASSDLRKGSRGSERKSRKAPSAFQPSSLNPSRPAHNRRASTDGLPVPNPPRFAPPMPVSAFDYEIPYHIGFNANRAPQTPCKVELRDLRKTLANTPLPLRQGEFPRVNKVFNNALGAGNHQQVQSAPNSSIMYAGSSSHYSPHPSTLPRPHLDDF